MYENYAELKSYLQKLQFTIESEKVFKFSDFALYKKGPIDDLMCCMYAILPSTFKKYLSPAQKDKKYNSVLAYSVLAKQLAKPFTFNKNYILINATKVSTVLMKLIVNIERDIERMEKEQ